MEALIMGQEDYLQQIRRIWENYKKTAIARRSSTMIHSRLEALAKLQDYVYRRHDQILAATTPKIRAENPYFCNDLFAEINDAIESVQDNLLEALQEFESNPAPAQQTVISTDTVTHRHVEIKPINLKKFSGELDEWVEFRDLFLSLVDNRDDLSKVQKLHYLKSSLDGHAARILRKIKVTETNYDSAWSLLCKRYEDPIAILYAYFDDFCSISPVGKERILDLQNLRDTAYEVYNDIVGINRPIDKWEDLFIYLILTKLDSQTRHAWEINRVSSVGFPTFEELDNFLSQQIRALSHTQVKEPKNASQSTGKSNRISNVKARHTSTLTHSCFVCGNDHPLYQCPTFNSYSVDQRIDSLKSQDRCFNCFRKGHRPRNCNSKSLCRLCKGKHHTLIHVKRSTVEQNAVAECRDGPPPIPNTPSTSSANSAAIARHTTLLPTATVLLRSHSGRSVKVRALLDQGAQASFVSQAVFQSLRATKKPVSVSVSGVGESNVGLIKYAASFLISPCDNPHEAVEMTALVLKSVTKYLPHPVQATNSSHLFQSLRLADDGSAPGEPIQLIIGSDYFGAFLRDGVIRGPPGHPTAQLTTFGWILSGPVSSPDTKSRSLTVNHSSVQDVSDAIMRFWELEEIPNCSFPTEEEEACERHFRETHSRTDQGRYKVALPFKPALPLKIGETRATVSKLFLRQEAGLMRNPSLKEAYDQFLSAYERLGHMREIPPTDLWKEEVFYLPHHPVLKEDENLGKIRVVFNASFKSSNNYSLNDLLMTGPKLIADLPAIILRWRSFRYVVATDLEKMFRQILVKEDDVDYQRIVWRASPDGNIKHFRLATVTYGTTCAPYLANRVLKQLADDEGSSFPMAAEILRNQVYVDDVMFGGDHVEALSGACEQLTGLLRAGGFSCHKWASNCPEIIARFSRSATQEAIDKFIGTGVLQQKVLGVVWNCSTDSFTFPVFYSPEIDSKRNFLSLVARIFDPFGWLSPFTVCAKILIQAMWLRKLAWDEPLPMDLRAQCREFQNDLGKLAELRIPRWTGQHSEQEYIQVHGFCDASNAAYAACIYLVVQDPSSVRRTSLIYAKTKAAPLKVQSIPRLELCAAYLLTQALKFVIANLKLEFPSIYCWTDSTVVLSWLRHHPSKWAVFAANRVSKIQSSFPHAVWGHVSSSDNPADCASRGITMSNLLAHPLW